MKKKNVDLTNNTIELLRDKYKHIEIFDTEKDLIEYEQYVVEQTGLPTFDALTGGMIFGRIMEMFGLESTGKTTYSLSLIGNLQRKGHSCAFIDMEHCFTSSYAKKLGVNLTQNFIVVKTLTGEDVFAIITDLVSKFNVKFIVVDSVAAMSPKEESIDGHDTIGSQARMMSRGLRKIVPVLSKYKATVLFLNQLRNKIGGYVPQDVTTGGNALKYFSSLRLHIKRDGWIKSNNNEIIGSELKLKAVKSKISTPFMEGLLYLYYNKGFVKEMEVLTWALNLDVIHKKGAWYKYGEVNLDQGLEKSAAFLQENPDLYQQILNEVSLNLGLSTGEEVKTD